MNYRNLSDAELATLAEGTKQYDQDPLFRELTWRCARSAGLVSNARTGSRGPDYIPLMQPGPNGPRENILVEPNGGA